MNGGGAIIVGVRMFSSLAPGRLRASTLFRAGAACTVTIVDIDGIARRFELRRGGGIRIPAHRFLAIDTLVGEPAADVTAPLTALVVDELTVRPAPHTRQLPRQLARLTSLRALRVIGARQICVDIEMKALAQLEDLSLEQCWLHGAHTWLAIAQFPRLRALSVKHSFNLNDHGIDVLNRLDGLEQLDVSFTSVSSAGLRSLRMPIVRDLRVRNLLIDSAAVAHLLKLRRLAHVDMRWVSVNDDADDMHALHARAEVERTDTRIGIDTLSGPSPCAAGDVDGVDFTFTTAPGRWLFECGQFRLDVKRTASAPMSLDEAEQHIEAAALHFLASRRTP